MGEDGDTLKDYCCISVKENQEEKYIDFNDILAYKKQENVDETIENLEALSNLIKDVYKKGAPIEYIKSTLDRSLDELYSNENNKETHRILLKKF